MHRPMHRRPLAPLVATLFAIAQTCPTHACDFCMLAQGVSPYLTATGKGVTVDATFTALDHLYNRATNIDSQGKAESWLLYAITGFYPLTEDLTVLAAFPYAVKTNIDYNSAANLNPGTLTSGIGDITLTGRYTLFVRHSLESTLIGGLLAGLKFPTGTTGNLNAQGQPVDRHGLPGTGSFDYDLGFSSSYAQASGFQLTLDLAYRISGNGDWAGRPHRYGSMLNYALKAYQRVAQSASGASFMPFVGLSGESMGKETGVQSDTGYDASAVNLSTGGSELLADLGLYAILGPSTTVNLGFAKTFYRYMNFDPAFDVDPATNYRLDFSVTYLF